MKPLGTGYQPTERLRPIQAFVMLWIVALALWPGQWSIPVQDRDEARYSQAATQMMETGDYVDIRFQEQTRYVKPAGIYWMQVVASQPFGGPEAPIGAFRLPSYFGILLISLGTAFIGARMMGSAYGALAGGIIGLSILAGAEGRIAKTDAMLVAAGTFAQLGLFQILVQPKGAPPKEFRRWPLLFWFASGLAVLIKGPIFMIFSAGTIIGYLAFTRDWRLLRRLRPLLGLIVFALVGLTWVGLITFQTDGQFLKDSVGHALLGKVSTGDDSHGGPPGYHLAFLPLMFWPGTALLGLAAVSAWKRRSEPAVIFLLSWIIPGWVLYEIVATKLPHYVMPAYPALAILAALGVKDVAEGALKGRVGLWIGLLLFMLIALALPVAAYFGIEELGGVFETPWVLGMCGAAVVTGLAGLVLLRRPTVTRAAWVSVPMVAFYALLAGAAYPKLAPYWPSHTMWRIATQLEGCQDPVFVTAGYKEPSNIFYLGTDTRLADSGAEAAQFLISNGRCGVAFVEERERESFNTRMQGRPVRELVTINGTNVTKGRQMELDMIVMGTSPLRIGEGKLRRL